MSLFNDNRMAQHNELGVKGETLALEHLKRKGYSILHTNWRYLKEEIDIVAMHSDMLVFVEVKTRSTDVFEDAQEAVPLSKQRSLVTAADAYIVQRDLAHEGRFDIIFIVISGERCTIEHMEDAFNALL
jgi:putative endonuclease